MKRLVYIFFACLLSFMAKAQDTIPNYLEDDGVLMGPPIYSVPEFPGGKQAMLEYFSANLHYPEQAVKDSIEGRVVVSFSLQADLSITNIEVLQSSGFALLDEEALRVLRSMPKWECKSETWTKYMPSIIYTVPINFRISARKNDTLILNQTQAAESKAAENASWQMTCDTVSLIGQMEVSLQPYFSIYSPFDSEGKLYFSLKTGTRLSHYGYQMGDDYHFCITPDGQLSKTSKESKTPREGLIPLTQTKEWDVNYVDVGEWGNYLSFSGKSGERVFYQPGYLRALFIQDSVFLTVSQSSIARITNPTSGRLMTLPKTGGWEDRYLYYENGAKGQEVLWTTDAFKIEWGEADTIIHGAFMVDDQLMLAMYINGNTGIYAFDGKDFQMEYDLGALSLEDDYSTLLNQLDHPNSLLMTFTDSNNRQGILHIKGRSIRLIDFLFPDRSLSVTPADPTIPMIRSMLDQTTLTIAQVDSIEQVYGGVSMDEEQYYTLLSDSSYLWRSYSYNDATSIVEHVQIERRNLNGQLHREDWHEWQDAFIHAFGDELSPIESSNSNFIAYLSSRFLLWVSKNYHNDMIVYFK